jgi:hypothetical protein
MNLRRAVLVTLGFSLALSAATLQAQQPPPTQQETRGSVTGIVRDAGSQTPIALVSVQLAGTSFGANTGPDGRYIIANVPAGIYTIQARRVGYSPTVLADVRVERGAPTVKDVALQTQALTLTGVVTTGLADPASGTRAPFSVATRWQACRYEAARPPDQMS